jgi:hypothetical protein
MKTLDGFPFLRANPRIPLLKASEEVKERVLRETEGIAREEEAMVEEWRVRRIRGRLVVVVKDAGM